MVALALGICAASCATTVTILARAQAARRPSSIRWLLAASAVFGSGVWSLHFVAMLGYMPARAASYSLGITVLSALIAGCGALVAFLSWRLIHSRRTAIVLGGVWLGLAISAMHYCGVAAMRLPGSWRLDSSWVAASVAVGIGFSLLALARAEALGDIWRRVEVSIWLALGICGMHFTGMAALRLAPAAALSHAGGRTIGSGSLAIAVASVSLAILLLSFAATLMDQHLAQRSALELRRMRLLGDIAREVLLIHRDGIILHVNAAGGRLFGVVPDQLVGQPLLNLVAPVCRRFVALDADTQTPSHEIEVRGPAGRLIPVEISAGAIDYEGRPATVSVLHDLSYRRRDAARIRYLAHHDSLTDLANRFLLSERLTYAIDTAGRPGPGADGIAVLHLDLDRFKPVNDMLGHAAGDAVLIEAARRLRAEMRGGDTIARVGADEFVIVTRAVDRPAGAAILAARLIETLAQPFALDHRRVEIGASVGIALYPGDGTSAESLIRAAGTALDRAKREARGKFRFFEAAMDEELRARRQLEQDLRGAIGRGELQLHYQPLISCATGTVDGFEALLRWNHPLRGAIPPAEFIPLAEETGLIAGIGEWVIETACAAAASWEQPRWVAVNVSPVQVRLSDLPAIVRSALARSGLSASRLEIEITEGVLIEDTGRALDVLSALRGLGARIALDDFGTGYSSLSYLRSFGFDKLKIDRSFIAALGQGNDATMIVRAIIDLAHNLGLSITAEGVETTQQLGIIRDLMCDQVQGYLLARPMPMEEFSEYVARRVHGLVGSPRIAAA